MAENVILTSFAGGELSTSLYGRVDLDKYHVGAMLLRNFFVDYRGGVSYRPGTKYCASVASDADGQVRLIPFIVSRDQSYVLAFSNLLVEVFLTGVLVATVVTPYTGAEVFDLKYAQSADVMTITHPAHPIYNLNRTGAYAFNLALQTIGSSMAAPGLPTITTTVAGPLQYCYVVTALSHDGEESLSSPAQTVASKALDPTAATPVTVSLTWTDVTDARSYNIYKAGPVPTGEPLPTVFGYIGQTKVNSFTDNNIGPDFGQIPPEFRDPFSPGQLTDMTITSAGAGATPYDVLTVTGDGTGASAYAISKAGAVLDTVVITGGKNYTTATIAPAAGSATFAAVINTDNHYPNCVAYFQQRRAFGGADISPTLIEMSKTGFYHNFDVSPAVLDSDAISINIASREVNLIQYMVPMSTGMVVFTRGSAFLLTGDNGGAITPANISATPQASTGAGNLPPLVINYNIVFNQYQGNVIRDMTFQWQTNSYYGADRSMLANHLFQGFHLLDWTWAEVPHKLLVCARNDGRAVVMTYVPEQDVYAWSHWDTQGLFRSFAAVPEGDETAVYTIVRRHVDLGDGSPCWHNYLERFMYDAECCIFEAWHLDSAVSLEGEVPAYPLFITPSEGATVTLTSYDPCVSPPPTTGPFTETAYVMAPQQNFDAAIIAEYDASDFGYEKKFWNNYIGASYNRNNRTLMYTAQLAEAATMTNSTGFTLDDGIGTTVADGATYAARYFNNFNIVTKSIDTGIVTRFNTFDITATVAVGINGSDGTYRRMTNADARTYQSPSVTDPRTQDIFVHFVTSYTHGANPCIINVFRFANDYKQEIYSLAIDGPNPYAHKHMEPTGLTEDYLYYIESKAYWIYDEIFSIAITPRATTADEVTVGYKSNYGRWDMPAGTESFRPAYCMCDDKSMYLFGYTMDFGVTPREYFLYQFEPPTSAPFGGPTVGGGITDVSPWGSADGPNTNVANFYAEGFDSDCANNTIYHDRDADVLICIADFDYNAMDPVGTRADRRTDVTYVRRSDMAFDYHEGWLRAYLTAEGASTSDVTQAAWAIFYLKQLDTDLNFHDYTFAGVDYNTRWIVAVSYPVVAGVVDETDLYDVFMEFQFTYGALPVLRKFLPETRWGAQYPAYATTLGSPNIVHESDSDENTSRFDDGITDPTQNAIWLPGSPSELWNWGEPWLTWDAGSGGEVTQPLLKLTYASGDIGVGAVIQAACGQISVDEVVDPTTANCTITSPLNGPLLPNDTTVYLPLLPGDWAVVTPTSTLLGLDHLEGKEVYCLADGQVFGPLTVEAGTITLPGPVTTAVAGLKYQGQMKTLRLDVGDPTVQGKRKVIPAVTLRLHCSAGMKVGTSDFENMMEPKYEPGGYIPVGTTVPIVLFTGDIRTNVFAGWQKGGVITIQQDQPLPCTILAVIPEVLFGDNQR